MQEGFKKSQADERGNWENINNRIIILARVLTLQGEYVLQK